MFYILIFTIVSLIIFFILRNYGAKRLFNVPWYYVVISLDISGSRGKLYGYKGINGVPDAIFRHLVKPKYIVGELKGRRLNPKAKIRGYEYAQIMLYIGILKKKYWLSSVEGRLVYKDSVKHIYFERNLFNEIIRMKPAALTVINRLQ